MQMYWEQVIFIFNYKYDLRNVSLNDLAFLRITELGFNCTANVS